MKKTRTLLAAVLLILSTMTFLSACGTKKLTQPYSISGFYFDTVVTFTIYDDPAGEVHAQTVGSELKKACTRYEQLFSATIPDSDISKINSAGGNPVEVQPETIDLLTQALYYAELTNGAFDPTMKVISDLWNIRSEYPRIPDPDSIAAALQHVDYRTISIVENTVTLSDPDAKIDLGGIAKGYIADRLTDYMKQQGITSAVISLGGNIVCLGAKPDDSSFGIGLQKPFGSIGDAIAVLQVSDATVVTSGNYERYFEKDGMIYHHIMDPSTGAPVQNDLYAVTILSDSSTAADALSTACYVLGEDDSRQLLQKLNGTEALFIDQQESIRYTKGISADSLKLMQ